MNTKQWSFSDWPLLLWHYMIQEFGPLFATILFLTLDVLVCFYTLPYGGKLLNWEARVRHAGMYLELFGLLTTVAGILGTQKKLNHRGLLDSLLEKIKRFPMPWKQVRYGSATMNTQINVISSAAVTTSPKEGETLENRISFVETKLNQQALLLTEVRTECKTRNEALSEALNQEKKEREKGDSENRKLIDDVTVGDIHIEAMGLVWLMVGIIFGTASNELAPHAKYLLSTWIPTP